MNSSRIFTTTANKAIPKPKGFIKLTGMPELADNRIIAPTFPAISG